MKISREQFEEWLYSNRMRGVRFNIDTFNVDGSTFYKSTETQGQWNAWQASRAAIEIELPEIAWDITECGSQHYDVDDVKDSIRAAGLTVKGNL